MGLTVAQWELIELSDMVGLEFNLDFPRDTQTSLTQWDSGYREQKIVEERKRKEAEAKKQKLKEQQRAAEKAAEDRKRMVEKAKEEALRKVTEERLAQGKPAQPAKPVRVSLLSLSAPIQVTVPLLLPLRSKILSTSTQAIMWCVSSCFVLSQRFTDNTVILDSSSICSKLITLVVH